LVTMLKDTRAAVERGCKRGKTLEQLKEEKVLEPWKNWSGAHNLGYLPRDPL
jgi:hypothetical protein